MKLPAFLRRDARPPPPPPPPAKPSPAPEPIWNGRYEPIRLPDLGVADGVAGGRAVREGYNRAVALEFGRIADQLEADPLLKEANAAAGGRSIVHPLRLANLFLLLTLHWEPLRGSDVVEFGSYRGGSALFMAAVLKRLDPAAHVHALDTFAGMPPTDHAIDSHGAGDFHDADLDGLLRRRDALRLDNLVIHEGLFEDTFPAVAQASSGFGLAHIDADIYSACRYAQDAVWPHMRPGGYLVYDDATTSTCLGATQAVEELIMERRIHSEQVQPHFVFRAGLGGA